MVKVVNRLNERGSVLVEHSDERLAAVEEAKRTGQELQSIGSKGADIVDREVLREEVERVSNEGSSDPEQPLPDYLYELVEQVDDTRELNQRKAAEHNEYSAEVVRAQQEQELSDLEKRRRDPMYFARLIEENNRALAAAYSEQQAEVARQNLIASEGVQQEVRELRPEGVGDPNPITALGQRSQVTNISESATKGELVTKDQIIFGEQSFRANAEAPREVAEEAESSNRAQEDEATAEPQRLEEPQRKRSRRAKSDDENESEAANEDKQSEE